MATTRKTLGDRLNAAADGAITTLMSISNGEITGGNAQTQVAAARTILNKVVPDLKAIDLSAQIKAEIGKVMIDLADD